MNRKTIDFFVKFAEVCFKRYKDKVKYWMTFNEINNQMNYKNDIFGWTNSGAHFGNYSLLLYKLVYKQQLAKSV